MCPQNGEKTPLRQGLASVVGSVDLVARQAGRPGRQATGHG